MISHRTTVICLWVISSSFLISLGRVNAAAYIGSNSDMVPINAITHPIGYLIPADEPGFLQVVSDVKVQLCISPASESIDDLKISARNAVGTWNVRNVVTDNFASGGGVIPSNTLDFESVLLHEMGHCLGLAHINLASESGLDDEDDMEFTQARPGPNGVFDIDFGVDGVIGTVDDVRGDDINRVWFRIEDNNPFILGDVIDGTTYSVDLTDLPMGDLFAAQASRAVDGSVFNGSEAVMQQGTFIGEIQRSLSADDVAGIRLAESGVDELQDTGGDDYTVEYEYLGVSTSDDCDVVLTVTGEDFAFCDVNLAMVLQPPFDNHILISNNTSELFPDDPPIPPAIIQLASTNEFNWFFNTELNANAAPEPPSSELGDPGASGSWFNPDRNGEGWVMEKLNEDTALVYWFTYPPSGGTVSGDQTWLIGVGSIDGNTYTFDSTEITSGATFGNTFDPAAVVRDDWGTLEFVFDATNPNAGVINYAGPAAFGSGSFPIERFVLLDSQANGSLPPGVSGSWFDPATDGEGWVVEVINDTQAVIYWFTYDENADQAWNLGIADIVGNALVMNEALESNGTNFGDDFTAADVNLPFFGSFTIVFEDCNNATLNFNTILGNGQRDLQRITSISGFDCSSID